MSDYFRPALYVSSTLYFLPKPIISCAIGHKWKFDNHEIPLKHGDNSYGHKLNSLTAEISGMCNKYGPITSEVHLECDMDQFDYMNAIKEVCKTLNNNNQAELILYYKATATTIYRKYKRVVAAAFDFDIGDEGHKVVPYNLSLIIEDTTLYTTAPGA